MYRFSDSDVARFFDTLAADVATDMLALRTRIFALAAADDAMGEIQERLKWGVPSYRAVAPKSGTPIRIAPAKAKPGSYELLVHCQTSVVEDFKARYPELNYGGSRSLIVSRSQVASDEVGHFVLAALTYRRA